ncbi:hypothetical protein CK216_01645 [Mesorhizobium sp. WSM3876]|nr:hypothetical protein CK216_01645 [Mesorhizobium sp. WSM3876]
MGRIDIKSLFASSAALRARHREVFQHSFDGGWSLVLELAGLASHKGTGLESQNKKTGEN